MNYFEDYKRSNNNWCASNYSICGALDRHLFVFQENLTEVVFDIDGLIYGPTVPHNK